MMVGSSQQDLDRSRYLLICLRMSVCYYEQIALYQPFIRQCQMTPRSCSHCATICLKCCRCWRRSAIGGM